MSTSISVTSPVGTGLPPATQDSAEDHTNQSGPSAFRKVAGAVVGGVVNMALPGAGDLLGDAIAGEPGSGNPLGYANPEWDGLLEKSRAQMEAMIMFQFQMNMEQRAFESASAAM